MFKYIIHIFHFLQLRKKSGAKTTFPKVDFAPLFPKVDFTNPYVM